MELLLSGVKVPKLGSIHDRIYRQYLLKKAQKEITLNRLMAHLVSESIPGASKEWKNHISSIWNNFVNLACYMEDEMQVRETEMQEEFKFWSKVKPEISKDKHGRLVVTGIPNLKEADT